MTIDVEVDKLDGRLPLNSSPISEHRQKKKAAARPLPLFACPNAGHVIFRGNEPLSPDEAYPLCD